LGIGALVIVVLLFTLSRGSGAPDRVDTAWLDQDPSGSVVYCSGADVSGSQQRSVEDFNSSRDSANSKARLVDDFDGAETADQQRLEYIRRTKAGECDVVYLDVIYMSEFASEQRLLDMTSYLQQRDASETFDARMMQTVAFDEKSWGIPKQLDGGVIYFRTDGERGTVAPASWQELLARAVPEPGERAGLRFQLDAYEGLTVVFLELAYAAGAEPIVSEDGKRANIDQPATLKALRFLREALQRRAVPDAVTRQGDAGSFYAFSSGRARFLRSWPYVESQLQTAARSAASGGSITAAARQRTADNHAVVALPPWRVGDQRVGILGGHNLVIPRTAKNPRAALHLVDFLTSKQQIRRDAVTASLAPVMPALWNDRGVRANRALRAVNDLELKLRPNIANYAAVSNAIYTTLRRVLSNRVSDAGLSSALEDIEGEVQSALDEG